MFVFDRCLELEIAKDLSKDLINLILPHRELLNCHMVDFITEDHWSSMINGELKQDADLLGLDTSADEVIHKILSSDKTVVLHNFPALNMFVKRVTDFHLDTVASKRSSNEENLPKSPVDDWWMKRKKNHEVHLFSDLVYSVTIRSGARTVIDFGCGKGYLSTLLSIRHNLKVLGLDCSDVNTHSAQSRHDKLLSSYFKAPKESDGDNPHETGQFIPITKCINMGTNLQTVLHDCLDHEDVQKMVLCGLHTCGNLGSTILKQFVEEPNARALCYIGCCYHLIQEEFSENPFSDDMDDASFGFPLSQFFKDQKASLGRNARMISSQSWQRLTDTGSQNQNKALFYRAVLQAILTDLGVVPESGKRVGKLAFKCKSFVQYFRKAVERLGVNKITISDEEILKLYDKYKDYESKLKIFQGLRVILAPVVEAVVIMDRIIFLLEDESVKSCHLVKVFDPLVSPRCYAIVAFKNDR